MKLFKLFIKQNPLVNLLFFIFSIIFFLSILVFVMNLYKTKVENQVVQSFDELQIYQISDRLLDTRETTYFQEKDSFKRLNDFANEIKNDKKFTAYTVNTQPMEVIDFKGGPNFSIYDEVGEEQITPDYRNGQVYHTIKSIQLNSNVLEMNHIQLKEGNYFTNSDYQFKKNKVIPVLLGADYEGIYQLNETIQISYYFNDFKAKIIGFIEKDEKVYSNLEPELILNDLIVLPVFYFNQLTDTYISNQSADPLFFKASLFAVVNIQLMSKSNPLEIRQQLQKISDKTHFNEYDVIGADGIMIDAFLSMSKVNIQLIIYANIAILLFMLASVYYVLYLKIKLNREAYLVLLISGLSYETIQNYLLKEISTVIGLAFLCCLLFSIGVSYILNYKLIIIAYSIVSTLLFFLLQIVSMYLLNRSFKTIDVIEQLKRG